MEPINTINTNLVRIIGNNPINVPNSNINRISGPSVIPTVDKPILQQINAPVVRGLEVPVIDAPNTTIQYPIVKVPTQAEFDASIRPQQKPQEQQPPEKSRGLPDPTPAPQLPPSAQTPAIQTPVIESPKRIAEVPADLPKPTFTVGGISINLPDPSLVATAGAVAVVTTAATMASTAVLNVLKNAAEPMLRDTLYEIENKVIIDEPVKDRFTKEGQERFKSLYAPPKKIAKKLSARLSF